MFLWVILYNKKLDFVSFGVAMFNKKFNKNQQGVSAWILLPWLLFFALAFVFWWFANERPQSLLQNDKTPAVTLPQHAKQTEAVFEPKVAEPMVDVAPSGDVATPVTSYHEAVSRAAVSVVNIYTTEKLTQAYADSVYYDDPLFRQFLEQYQQNMPNSGENNNLGSGVIVSEDGYIVTNAHVVARADEIIVALHDGRKAQARVIGVDKESDLAVIQIELDNLVPLPFRKTPIRVGDVTLAIGNPFGVGQTVTQGIVSATERTNLGVSTYENFIQTDAAINPGNSGGALTDAHGALIGINTVIYSRSGGSMGIGFAIPTVIVERVMNDLIKTGHVSRGWLGIEIGRVATDPANLNEAVGVVVAHVLPNGPADKAGLRAGDVIVSVDGVPTNDASKLMQIISEKTPDSTLKMTIKRQENKQEIVATLAQRPTIN